MLPQVLSETLCSLTAGIDKLTFSVVFTMTADGKILSTWFGKTIINSAGKLAYGDAQDVLEGRKLPDGNLNGEHKAEDVEEDIKMLGVSCAVTPRDARSLTTLSCRTSRATSASAGSTTARSGSTTSRCTSTSTRTDSRTTATSTCARRRTSSSRRCVLARLCFIPSGATEHPSTQFMLLANISVAGKIAAGLPDQALLRRHEPPVERRLVRLIPLALVAHMLISYYFLQESFVERMKGLKVELDGSSSGALMKTINNVTDPSARLTLQHLSTKVRFLCFENGWAFADAPP